MSYQTYKILRTSDPTLGIVFNDTPPEADGVYLLPRQVFKIQEMEAGTVNLEYGVDRGGQVVSLTFSGVPECVLLAWETEYLDLNVIDQTYGFYDHRTPSSGAPKFLVKWKDLKAEYVRTLPNSDAEYWYDYFKQIYPAQMDDNDLDYYAVADLYKVTMEFFVLNQPLYP